MKISIYKGERDIWNWINVFDVIVHSCPKADEVRTTIIHEDADCPFCREACPPMILLCAKLGVPTLKW